MVLSRLGHLSFDSNEATRFQARELKSVHVSVTASVIKIVLHKCHHNKLNIYNQARPARAAAQRPAPAPALAGLEAGG